MVPDWIFGEWGHPCHHESSWYVIIELCAKCHQSSMIRSVSRTPLLWNHTWRTLMVPDCRLGGLGHPWHHESLLYVILDLFAIFQLSSIIRSVPRTPSPRSHTWKTLMVPGWSLGGLGHPWHHGSSSYVNIALYAKFQLSSMIRSVSRSPRP